jgi:hypothetical protein
VLVCVVVVETCALATPSGLNNIPTADVVGPDVLVLQGFGEFGRERAPAWFAGLKLSPAEDWEVGFDDIAAGPGAAGGPTVQAKYRIRLRPGTGLALGAANISDDRARHGDVFPYAVVSSELGRLRGHLGCSWQSSNGAWFLGVDASASEKLTLRADWTEAEDVEESVASLGFINSIGSRWLVEVWASFPTARGADTSYTVKLDCVVPLGCQG